MAISAKNMRPLNAAALNQMIDDMEAELRQSWAVYGEYEYEPFTYKIVKIVPWADRDYETTPIKIDGAIDEMDAYKKAIERLSHTYPS